MNPHAAPTAVAHAGEQLRPLRSNEHAQILVCAALGAATGAIVALLHALVDGLHRVDFALPNGRLLSSGIGIDAGHIALVPVAGGVIVGLIALAARRWRMKPVVDPIEANALYGGQMSLLDSMRLTLMTIVSTGAGASLGMDAGYSQLGSGLFAHIGRRFGLRREDQRVFVTAGAAAAIAAAFSAPLAGAFYGFELILGTYTISSLMPVAIASVSAVFVADALYEPQPWFPAASIVPFDSESYLIFAMIGALAAAVGILAMLMVTWSERTISSTPIPEWLHPALGGAVLSLIAIYFPQVLGSGHDAIQYHFSYQWALLPLALLLIAKITASAVSIGSGFRGGLFSASLLIGALFGALCAGILSWLDPALSAQQSAFMLVGMGSTAAAIIGAPLTMVFLVLESTGDFAVAVAVLVGVLVASTIVRLGFGYSFATWRFHQRGVDIRGAHDVGWIAELTVGRLMFPDPEIASADAPMEDLQKRYAAENVSRILVTEPDGRYAGTIDMAAIHASDGARIAREYAARADVFLLPGDNVRTALARFEEYGTESLPVLSSASERKIVGYLTEQYAFRRYTQELERRRSVELGRRDLFTIGPMPER